MVESIFCAPLGERELRERALSTAQFEQSLNQRRDFERTTGHRVHQMPREVAEALRDQSRRSFELARKLMDARQKLPSRDGV